MAFSVLRALDAWYLWALFAIVVLRVPHGALDGKAARSLLRPHFGWA